MGNSGIPVTRQYAQHLVPAEVDLNSFYFLQEIKDDIVNFVNNGESLYIFSKNFGNGKTSWAIKLLTKYFDEVWAGNGFRCRGLFVHVPTFLTKLKENISTRNEDFELMRSRLDNVDLVVWDDIASSKLTDYDHVNLLTYIDQRVLNGLSNVYTGNLGIEELPAALGNRLSSRVWNESAVVEFLGIDRRGSNG